MKHDNKLIYPFAEHEIFVAWIQEIIECRRTLSPAKFFMKQNPDLIHSSIQELATHIWNNGSSAYVQHIYKYASNITGSDPYWFHRRWKLTAQSNQEGLQSTIFWTLSAAYNNWRPLIKLLDGPLDVPIKVRYEAVRKHPHIVAIYFF